MFQCGFIENFTRSLAPTIISQDSFFSATQDGKIGLVSSEDIASAALTALTAKSSPNNEQIILGPELLTYDEVGASLKTNCVISQMFISF
jgi:uncharacterized protein YbjT (DUF2867 family)